MSDDISKQDLIARIRTIKGHLGGIEKMIDKDTGCEQILVQMAAVKSAMDKVSMSIIESYTGECLLDASESKEDLRKKIKETMKVMMKFTK